MVTLKIELIFKQINNFPIINFYKNNIYLPKKEFSPIILAIIATENER